MSKLPIGIQSFEDLRRNEYLYVDKTAYINSLVQSGKVYFLSRPRRFGKSLLISAMEAYFEGKKDLFHGLAIEKDEERSAAPWTVYPVIHFSFSGGEYREKIGLEDALNTMILNTMSRYDIPESEIQGETVSMRFRNLILNLWKSTGRQVVILVDEYDKPLLVNMYDNKDQEEKNRELFRSFFSVLKDMDGYLKFVFITGVTKFSKVSIFSDLNQMRDISLTPMYSSICGITEDELSRYFREDIETMAKAQGMSPEETQRELAAMYDGYHFSSDSAGVYNPFSLLSALEDRDFGRYWFENGTPRFLINRLALSGMPVEDFTEGVKATKARMNEYRAEDTDVVPMLYQTGYLTISGYSRDFREYTLSYPNDEVKFGYLESLIPMVRDSWQAPDDSFSAQRMIGYLSQNQIEPFMEMLKALLASIPYYEGKAPENEQQWRNVVYAVFAVLGQFVKTEVHSARGRCDCVIETGSCIYLFEFKQDKTPEEALDQIEDKGYALPYLSGKKTIIKVGADFSSVMRTLDAWKAV